MAGIAKAVDLPDRGAMIANITSSNDARSSGPWGSRLPSNTPVWSAATSFTPSRDGRSSRARAVMTLGESGAISRRPARPGRWENHRRQTYQPATPRSASIRTRRTTMPTVAAVACPGHRAPGPSPRRRNTPFTEESGQAQPPPTTATPSVPPRQPARYSPPPPKIAPRMAAGAAMPPPDPVPLSFTRWPPSAASPCPCRTAWFPPRSGRGGPGHRPSCRS